MLNGIPRILIVRLSAIGDVVRVLPALHSLRAAHPNAQIDWAVEHKAGGILEGHPAIDRLLVFERPARRREAVKAFWRFCKEVRDGRYDLVVDFHGILKSGLLTFASAAPDRYGFAPPRSQEGSHRAYTKAVKLPSQRLNRVEENLLLCEALGPLERQLDVVIHVPEDIQNSVDRFIDETFDGGKFIVVVHAPVDRPEKRWPEESFATLCDMLLADGRFEVLLTYGPGQRDVAHRVAGKARRSPMVAPETPDLKHLAWLLHRSHLYVGGDTGPMHIACAMGTPVVAIFGGTDPLKHAPWRSAHEVLYLDDHDGTDGVPAKATAPARLARITPEGAYEACLRLATLPMRQAAAHTAPWPDA